MVEKNESTRERILEAAKDIFYKKGLSGARMQEIADEAGINKAMLHYYFKSKNELFEQIFVDALGKVVPKIASTIELDLPLEAKFAQIVSYYYDILKENPQLPVFVLNALQSDPEQLGKSISEGGPQKPPAVMGGFIQQLMNKMAAQEIKTMDPRNVVINLIAMTVFPFMLKPVMMALFQMEEKEFQGFIEQRKEMIPAMLIDSISMKP